MIIRNFSELSTTEERKDALEIVNAGIEAVLTKNAMQNFVSLSGDALNIKGRGFNLKEYDNIYVIGGGKASADMAEEIERVLGDRITEGIVTSVTDKQLEHIEVVKGTHPLPSQTNMDACKRMVEIAEKAGENDLLLCLISGGGSAILAYPRTNLQDLIEMNKALLTKGTDIYETNAVRKHISMIKGGQLSKIAHPATVVSIIISDVLGNDLSVIASGPTVKDESTLGDANDTIEEYKLPHISPKAFKETPKEDKWFEKTHNILLLTNEDAARAMRNKAEQLGYDADIQTLELKGEAREVGKRLAQGIEPGKALIAAGETTVTVKGHGKGGRNQEFALGAIGNFNNPGVVISAGTDGIDNTDAAGAIADEKSAEKAQESQLEPYLFLDNNDAYNFFQQMNDLIITGPTGTNVADIMLALGKKQ